MKSVIKVDFENKVIYMNRIFAKEAANAKSDEYRQLQEVRKDYPDYPVKIRTIKKQPLKESYKGLTYDFMENYILTHPNSIDNKTEFDKMITLSKCHSLRYPTIKKWFLYTFPEMRDYNKFSKMVIGA